MALIHGDIHLYADEGVFAGVHSYPLGLFGLDTPVDEAYTQKPCIILAMGIIPSGIVSVDAVPSAMASLGETPIAAIDLDAIPTGTITTLPIPTAQTTFEECNH